MGFDMQYIIDQEGRSKQMDVFTLATNRRSNREFSKREVSADNLGGLKDYFASCPRLVPDIDVEMLILGEDASERLNACVGYHRFLIKAAHYIVLLSDVDEHYMENAGYIGEELVLKLTEMGIQTCWETIADGPLLKKRLNLSGDKSVAAVIAFGYEDAGLFARLGIKSPAEIFLKKKPGTAVPKLTIPQMFYDDEWGKAETISALDPDDDLYRACAAACYAPSFLNLQPFRLIHDGDKIVLVAVLDEMTDAADARLNLGITMMHFEGAVSRQSSGFQGWKLETPDKDYKLPDVAYVVGYYQL